MTLSTEEFDLRLGAMVRAAAGADFAFLSIAQNLCDSRYGAMLIAGESTDRVLKVCKTLVDAHDDIADSERESLRVLIARGGELFPVRHRYVHGTAIFDLRGALLSIRTRRLKEGLETAPVDLEELDSLRRSFEALTGELVDWLARSIFVVPRQAASAADGSRGA